MQMSYVQTERPHPYMAFPDPMIQAAESHLLEQEHTLFAQHMFVKMHLTGTERGSSKHQVLELINEYGGKVVDFGEEHLTAEITGTKEKVDSFVEKIRKFGILELSSSGDIAIGIGWDNTLSVAPREAEEDQPEP